MIECRNKLRGRFTGNRLLLTATIDAVNQASSLVRLISSRKNAEQIHIEQTQKLEANLIKHLTQFFVKQSEDIVQRLMSLGSDSITGKSADASGAIVKHIFNPEEWDRKLVDTALPWMADGMARAMEKHLSDLLELPTEEEEESSTKATTASRWLDENPSDAVELADTMKRAGASVSPFSEFPDRYQKRIMDELNNSFKQPYWKGINRTTQGIADEVLRKGIVEGKSIRGMASDMKEALGGDRSARIRATAIARTESAGALNSARKQATNQVVSDLGGPEKVPMRSAWISALANRTREDHAALDGVIEDANGMWNLGGSLIPWPAHFSLPASQRVNCLCSTIVDFVDEKRAKETIKKAVQIAGAALLTVGVAITVVRFLRIMNKLGPLNTAILRIARLGIGRGRTIKPLAFDDVPEVLSDEAGAVVEEVFRSEDKMRAVGAYTSGAGKLINKALRSGEKLREFEPLVNTLDGLAARSLPYRTTVYRGVLANVNDFTAKAKGAMKSGATLSDKAFSSTSLSAGVAAAFAGELPGVILQISTDIGSLLYEASSTPSELEILLPRNAKLKILGIDTGVKIFDVVFTVIRAELIR